ncbi:nitric oxide reductase transcriptional regulator NorR [Marinomonas algicola]|uniref:nitric oxide reductase transcriptional regulator NorR n=1 Tax=Marinomonas algicola TaxID=2773454 RepID=UPI00174CD9C3|nr:nitric oxide reductase transcriptional regulator NorR [Marinomonas algicola]
MAAISSNALIDLAIDLTNSVTGIDRFDRLLTVIRQTISCDAVVLLRQQGRILVPLAQHGLLKDTLGRRFDIDSHPRFLEICRSKIPIVFEKHSPLPDPYDGMLLLHEGNLPIHACMGLPLLVDNEVIGVLTLDSMEPNVFDDIPQRTLDIISAMSAATLNTSMLLQTLETQSQHVKKVVLELTTEALVKDGGEIIGNSPAMCKLKHELEVVAPSDFATLIEGETGVGKELVARTLHHCSSRSEGPLVYVNCAALPENLVESELFGHVKGAFTGADRTRAGKFSLANGGTLFLDEIGELPLAAQGKLLRVLQSHEIQPVGQDAIEYVDVRILAATNRVLAEEVKAKRFRVDLYHRLSVFPIKVPALRERSGDVPLLAGYFAEQTRRKLGLSQLIIDSQALELLSHYHWPGNVRELEHVIIRAALHAKANTRHSIPRICVADVNYLFSSEETSLLSLERSSKNQVSQTSDFSTSLKDATDQFQRSMILQAWEHATGNWSVAAKLLSMDRANLIRLSKRLGITVVRQIKRD